MLSESDLTAAARRVAEATRDRYDPDPANLRALLHILDAVARSGDDAGSPEALIDAFRESVKSLERARTKSEHDAAYAKQADLFSTLLGRIHALAAIALADAERVAAVAEGWRTYENAKGHLGGKAVLNGLLIEADDFAALDAAVRRLAGLPDPA